MAIEPAVSQVLASEVEAAIETLLRFVGEDPARDGLRKTPDRVRRSLLELTEGYRQDPAAILSTVFDEEHDELIVVKRIPFVSLCEHHLLPFTGHATVGYIPNGKVVGLSKIARLVHCFARRLQIQERLTRQIAQAMERHLNPRGVGVVIEATHSCMAIRGARAAAPMVTSCVCGTLRVEQFLILSE